MSEILINPVGIVRSEWLDPYKMPLGGEKAVIEIYPPYQEALQGIEDNSHIWVLAWFHKSERRCLKATPRKVNPDLPEYGVFALRAWDRPNPIGMCLARLDKVDGNLLYVSGLDAIGGTPVMDIKPYVENDTIFSPKTPYIRGKNHDMRLGFIFKRALVHHQEECRDLHLAARMAAIAEEQLGKLNEADLRVEVTGSSCLADCIQGIARARLANPPRFSFQPSSNPGESVWIKQDKTLKIRVVKEFTIDEIKMKLDEEIFILND